MSTPADFRLPAGVQPVRYRITLAPDLQKFTFQGQESIEVQVAEPTAQITVNAAELQISAAHLTLADGARLPARTITLDKAAETATFHFDRTITPGAATLDVTFQGVLNDQLRGFYRSRYTSPDGQEHYLATTQFEATDARRAFPCWDEPALKAEFRVTLVVPAGLAAISNMPVEQEVSLEDGTRALHFATSPRMSTYLLALVVGDLASVEATAPGGTLARVWATRGKEEQGRFALENAVRLLGFFNQYFGIPYPLPKLDHIAIPDFESGAMENWGAITYRETALLFDPETSAASTRQRIVEVVAHEMAHMWFGDLVTMEWWDDLWLNESFASWMGNKAVDALYPEWQMWAQFVAQNTNAGLALDGLRNSHPIEARVRNAGEIRELFDAISYNKGAAVLWMLEGFLGAETCRRGINLYLSAHQYRNARTEHLWRALEEASGKPVASIMERWTQQMGYPLIHAAVRRRGAAAQVHLSQQQFLYEHLLGKGQEEQRLWKVPVSILRAGTPGKAEALLESQELVVPLGRGNGPLDKDWVKVNEGQTGFYRVNYQPREWDRLHAAVEALELPASDRLGLQDDAYALVRAGFVPATRFLSLVTAYVNESDASVWLDLSASLRGLEGLLSDEPYHLQFVTFARDLYRQIVPRVGWDPRPGEGLLDALLRSTVLGQSGHFGNTQVVQEALRRFDRFLEDPSSLIPDLRAVVFSLVAQQGGRRLYDTLWDRERRASSHEEKMRFLGALTRFPDPGLLQETLERSLSIDVRSQDAVFVVTGVAANRLGRGLAWEFVKANWGEFDRRYGAGGFAIMRLISLTGGFTTRDRAREVEEFFWDHPVPAAHRTVQQSLERIRLNVAWLGRNRRDLGRWLAASR
ncbi:MAG: M1 family metallopeptidase [Chloroflexi bacterium]|nr:M1 family metallopeptidase [Chloroflexota bacterium]